MTDIVEGEYTEETGLVTAADRRIRRRGYVPLEPPRPWERQPGEPARAYRGLTIYRDLDPEERTLAMVARELQVSPQVVAAWAKRWIWGDRSDAWTQHVDRMRENKRVKDLLAMSDRHANTAILMQSKVVDRLRNVQPETLSNRDIDRWLEKATRIERMARGLDDGGIKLGVAVQVNNQNQSQAQAAAAAAPALPITPARKAIESSVASNPASIVDANRTIRDLLSMVEHSTRNG